MFWSIASNGVFCMSIIVATLYCAGDVLDAALNSPFPFAAIAQQATGSTAGATRMGVGLTFMAFWLPWPSSRPTTAEGMNWAGPITGFVLLASAVACPFVQRRWRGVDEMVVDKVVRES